MRFIMVLSAVGFLFVTTARADEEKVEIGKLPTKVLDTVKKKFPDADLKGASKETDKGVTLFEVALKHKGTNYDVTLNVDGEITELEKEITAKDLPAEVSKALDTKYGKTKFEKTEHITKGDKVYYEVLFTTAEKKKLEVQIDPKGKILNEEKKDPAKDKD